MVKTSQDDLDRLHTRLYKFVDCEQVALSVADAIVTLVNAYDPDNIQVTKPEGETYRTTQTRCGWYKHLTLFAREMNLLTATIDDVKQVMQAFNDGTTTTVESDGIKKSSLTSYASSLRRFYHYHDCAVIPDEIPMPQSEGTSINPEDMLTREEIQTLRTTPSNPRDKLIIDLLLYTGQRNNALRTLRVKDINLEAGTYRYNTEVDGLKGADERDGNRPLLGAINAVRTWLNEYHPDPQPDHYLITQQPSYRAVNPSEPVSRDMLSRVMIDTKSDADIDKPLHPHAMRHNFVTICKRDYDMDDDDIKYLIGHRKGSNVMSTTYSHLSGADHTKNAQEAWGLRDTEDNSPLTPNFCTVCDEPMPSETAKACPNCGTVYTPDAKYTSDMIEDEMHEQAKWADPPEKHEHVDEVREYLKENKAEVLNLLAEID